MESVLRAASIYVFLLVIFRITGKHPLAQITTFDFVLMLIIGESTQQALLGNDFSVANAAIVIVTLVFLDLGFSAVKHRWPRIDRALESLPVVILEHGKPIEERMRREQIDLSEILAAARTSHGIARLDEIRFAVLERSGGISIIPKR